MSRHSPTPPPPDAVALLVAEHPELGRFYARRELSERLTELAAQLISAGRLRTQEQRIES